MAYDIYQFFRLIWALPYVVWPFTPAGSGYMAELAPTAGNIWCLVIHTVLIVLQLAFIIAGLPALVMLPVWVAAIAIGLCLGVNHVLCMLLNGRGIEYHSNPACAPALPEHAHEQWIFLNGVAVGSHWMQSNLDRLALTFKRPVLGIHNKTSGVIFDVIECLIQRNFTYATKDVRRAYAIVKDKLYEPEITKVVFILHSQGCIEGGLVLDWLLQELPRDLLAKLEVYTFGNAANHFNNPHHAFNAQRLEIQAARHTQVDEKQTATVSVAAVAPVTTNGNGNAPRTPKLSIDTAVRHTTTIPSCAIGHIEHYAHSTDFVALWGVLHFVNTARGSHTIPRFLGRVFARSSPQGGHQFIQHYLDGMFPMERDPVTGKFVGCAEENEFMESDIEVGREGDESANVHEAFEQSWLASLAEEGRHHGKHHGRHTSEVEIQTSSPVLVRDISHPQKIKVKDVSRLWQYRNGRSPDEKPRCVGPATMA